mmetsp:Transcript_35615/g.46876  ORF Transcript_35615/g.46876 Transcript_35615/m.46876 type:complete len:129 (+) Transcript_35615:39-425(+)|eukprot:CAMPEP_0185569944 /NCGR_PEP_ID=MMETSP0434-20130131/2427_1 /TAXON_ID=626734 ORGANISM="Favella taraikaensis, Strain Fe Narragansett Bay" /NCGR_SAMPLE_ID=MMETSP0434 /ASSEMBLY_ACC=CAM_ASM_000379 /LENGTH=128 /DNA_ID=CAMNT_0028184921 /DNA_START=29 /DNA_END=415 /DNA_ORIENTATION=+
MIFSFAPHFVGTVQSVLDFLHLRDRPQLEERKTPTTTKGKARLAVESDGEEISEINEEEDSGMTAAAASDGADFASDDEARSYESDDHEWMDTNYFRGGLVPTYQGPLEFALALLNAPLRETGKLISG